MWTSLKRHISDGIPAYENELNFLDEQRSESKTHGPKDQ